MSDHVSDTSPVGPYARSAGLYSENGWHPLPVLDGGKGQVPKGFTGYHARKVTGEDISRWIDEQDLGGSNVCLRLFYEVGIDIDSYEDTKKAREAWDDLYRRHGEPPPTVRVSARFGEDYDGLAGIRIYRLARKYRRLVEQCVWHSQIGSGIDLIRLGHRQVVVWPSVHPKRDTVYQWLDERTGEIHDGPLPRPEELPELPDVWVEQVLLKQDTQQEKKTAPGTRQKRSPTASEGSVYWTGGKPCQAVQAALGKARRELEDGRHDGTLKHMTALTRLGEQGHQGVTKAIDTLHGAFLTSTEGEDRDSEGEWERMADGVDEVIEADGLTPDTDRRCCEPDRPKRKAADRVLDLAGKVFTLGRTVDDRPFIVPKTGANVALFRARARAALADAFHEEHGTTISDKPLKEAWTVLERRALTTDPVDLPVRVATHNGGAVLDLGTADGRCIVVDATGWRVEPRSPVTFRRPKPLLPLDEPTRGEDWSELWGITNITAGHRDLVRGWLLCALVRFVPHPILRIKGPQGAAKTTASKTLARVLDPSSGDAAKPPTSADRWEMTVAARWMVPVDNVSHIPEWWADDLCRTVTGAGTVDRELYTDDDVVVKRLRAVVILNGITMPGEMRPDLLERTLSVEVARPAAYLSEEQVEARVQAMLPGVLGLLLDDLVAVLSHTGDHADVSDLRMNDFATVLAKLDEACGTHALAEYRENLHGLAGDALESDPVATALEKFMHGKTLWTGSAADLLQHLRHTIPGFPPENWPKDATRLSGWLLRSTTTLLHVDLTVERLPRTKHGRLLRVRRVGDADAPGDAGDAEISYLNLLVEETLEAPGRQEGSTVGNTASPASPPTPASPARPIDGWATCSDCESRFMAVGGQSLCINCRRRHDPDPPPAPTPGGGQHCQTCRAVFVPTGGEDVCRLCAQARATPAAAAAGAPA